MKLGDIVSRVVIDPRKLTEYALDPESPWGRLLSRGARELRSGGELSLAPLHLSTLAPAGDSLSCVQVGSSLTELMKPGW